MPNAEFKEVAITRDALFTSSSHSFGDTKKRLPLSRTSRRSSAAFSFPLRTRVSYISEEESMTVGTPITITGTLNVFSVSSRLLFPIPEPGQIPVSQS